MLHELPSRDDILRIQAGIDCIKAGLTANSPLAEEISLGEGILPPMFYQELSPETYGGMNYPKRIPVLVIPNPQQADWREPSLSLNYRQGLSWGSEEGSTLALRVGGRRVLDGQISDSRGGRWTLPIKDEELIFDAIPLYSEMQGRRQVACLVLLVAEDGEGNVDEVQPFSLELDGKFTSAFDRSGKLIDLTALERQRLLAIRAKMRPRIFNVDEALSSMTPAVGRAKEWTGLLEKDQVDFYNEVRRRVTGFPVLSYAKRPGSKVEVVGSRAAHLGSLGLNVDIVPVIGSYGFYSDGRTKVTDGSITFSIDSLALLPADGAVILNSDLVRHEGGPEPKGRLKVEMEITKEKVDIKVVLERETGEGKYIPWEEADLSYWQEPANIAKLLALLEGGHQEEKKAKLASQAVIYHERGKKHPFDRHDGTKRRRK